ncbi:thiamine phosphate synthase [Nocardioides bruguierae]|uniref:thiamine phosphate synthase n=1 Tax=Nocardioides bruguierae TaxID=2945102 RepID=UPI0020201E15|nr:thiamine phosphate synthase [Nocardioides bruguierae]MCL8025798.1 thiamine phosphate synthase [Nocardioides bruguierae]
MSHAPLPRLVLLTDRAQLRLGRDLVRTLRECAHAGLRAVVLREPDLVGEPFEALVREAAAIPGLTLLLSRRTHPLAAGTHLAAHQPSPHHGCWGRSCHAVPEVRAAAAEGASWATLSPWGATLSKPGYGPPVGRDGLADVPLPVLALGGITTPEDAADALASGAHGVAVMGAVMAAADPARMVASLLAALPADAPATTGGAA